MNTQRTTNLNRTLSEMQNTLNDIKTSLNVLEARVNTLCDRESTALKSKVMLNRIWGRCGMGETENSSGGALPSMDERIRYLDFTSLYPSINRAVQYPVGQSDPSTEQADDSKDHVR